MVDSFEARVYGRAERHAQCAPRIGPPETLSGASRVAAVLKLGGARDAGQVTVGGRSVRRITVTTRDGTCVYDVDPATYLGLRWACAAQDGGKSIETWDYTPRTAQTGDSLSLVAQHPGALVDRGPVQPCPPGRPEADTSTPPCIVYSPGG